MKIKLLILSLFFSVVAFGQTTIAAWTFPTTSGAAPSSLVAECGVFASTSNLYADGTNGSSSWSTGTYFPGVAPTVSLCSVTTATGAYSLVSPSTPFNNNYSIVFKVPTTGYQDLILTYSTRGTSSGYTNHDWSYSTDGVTFTAQATITGRNATAFSTQTVDFSAISTLDNLPFVYIKLTVSGATATNGNNRLDNINFSATTTATASITLADNTPQVTAANISQATTSNILSTFTLNSASSSTTLNNAVFTTGGSYQAADIPASGLKLWYNSTNTFATATQVGSALTSASTGTGETLTFSSLTQNIPVGTSYFWITTDISATATTGRTINVNAISSADLTFASGTKAGSASAAGVQTIVIVAPAKPATFSKVCVSNTSVSLVWTAPATGTYDGYLLVVREAATPHAVTSIVAATSGQSLDYTLAPQFGSTTQYSRILYIGTGTSATVTGLTQGLTYYFALYAYKNNGSSTVYSPAITTTSTMTLTNVTGASSVIGNTLGTLNWSNPTSGCYDQILIVATSAAGITFVPTGNGSGYTANTVFSAYNQVVYTGSGNAVTVTGLTNGTTYYFEIFVRNGTEWSSGVEVSLTPSAVVPTTLKTGDVVLIAYDNSVVSTANDAIRFLTFVDINPGTKFIWANATYETGGLPASNVRTDKWYSCIASPTGNVPFLEITYNGATIISAGSVFCLDTDGTVGGTASTISAISNTGTSFPNSDFSIVGKQADGNSITHNVVNVSSSSPDAMFLMQGNFVYDIAGSTFNGTVLSGVQDGGLWYDLSDDLSGITGDNLRKSRKHPSLLCASIQANATPAKYEMQYDVSTRLVIGNKPQLLASVLNFSTNWINSYGTCPSPSPFAINASDNFNKWTGILSTNWFDCNNWTQLLVPDEITDVVVDATATNDAKIDYNAPYSDKYVDLALCKDLTITGRKVILEGSSNNVLEVHGNLLIDNPAGLLDIDDSNSATADGIIKLFGNWTNNVGNTALQEGNSTIAFVGSTPQIISNVTPEGTETFYNVELGNDFNTAISNNVIATGNLVVDDPKIVTINTGNYIQVNKNFTNNGTVNIEDTGALYQVDDAGVDTGNISMKRTANIKKYDYVYWSSPIKDFNTTNISPATSSTYFWKWNPTVANPNGGKGFWENAYNVSMTAAKGYIVRAPDAASTTSTPYTAQFINNTADSGKPNNGVVTIPIEEGTMTTSTLSSYTSANGIPFTVNDDNWNLVGNPYPSSINAITFLQYNAVTNPVIEGAVRVWTHGTTPNTSISNPYYNSYMYNYTTNDYITYNLSGASSGPSVFNGYIGAGQGFFVLKNEVTPSSTATLTFNNSMRAKASGNNSQFYRNNSLTSTEDDKHRIWLDIINSAGSVVRTLVGYIPNATLSKDVMYDAYAEFDGSMNLYSLINTEKVCIQGRPVPFDENDTVPLGVVIPTSGNYTIAIGAVDGLFEQGQNIYLEDRTTNTINDIRVAPYSFTSVAGDITNRFVLRYTNPALSTNGVNLNENSVKVAVKNSVISIKSINEKITDVTVYDLLGREVMKKNKVSENEIILNTNLKNQTLIVKIQLENGTIVNKKVVI